MDFGLSEPQRLLQRSIADYLEQNAPIERVRTAMETETDIDRDLLAGLGEQGITGLLISEEHGGSGLGLLDAVVAAQELGRGATPVPFDTACVLAPLLLQTAGSDEQQAQWLPGIADGTVLPTVVLSAPLAAGGSLDGHVPFVPDASAADLFVIHTGEGSERALYLVPEATRGLGVQPMPTVDQTRPIGDVVFDGLRLDADSRMVSGDVALAVDRAVAAARISLAADALGAAQKSLSLAVDYSLQRQQFGRVIGSYQAVKHMCAEMVAAIDPVQSLLWYTAFAWDLDEDEARHLAPLLKAHATEVATESLAGATQVFGGMGFTWECDVHIWFKRAGYDRQMLGSPAELRRLAADLQFPHRKTG